MDFSKGLAKMLTLQGSLAPPNQILSSAADDIGWRHVVLQLRGTHV